MIQLRMSVTVFNKLEKLAAPPFLTVSLSDDATRRNILKTWSKLKLCDISGKTSTFSSEGDLLKAFIHRKGTQLRLEKAMMFTHRIHTVFSRWKGNAFWEDFSKFREAFESDDAKLKPTTTQKTSKGKKKTGHVKGSSSGQQKQEVRLPSRQWANWVIYLILRDLLLLSKIKCECERTVSYWLGLISCSHHVGDSLVIVGILSRMWAVSSGIVEDYANQVYPSLRFISSLLSATKADNWLEDIDFPNELFTWLEKILGFPFKPASIGGYEQILSKSSSGGKSKRGSASTSSSSSKMDTILSGVFGEQEEEAEHDKTAPAADVPSTSSRIRDLGTKLKQDDDDEEEDLGVPVHLEQEQHAAAKKRRKKSFAKTKKGPGEQAATSSTSLEVSRGRARKKVDLDERWTNFFKKFKTKLETEQGRKQLLGRIKKYKCSESNQEISTRLIKLRKFVKGNKRDKLQTFIPKFKRFLSNKD